MRETRAPAFWESLSRLTNGEKIVRVWRGVNGA